MKIENADLKDIDYIMEIFEIAKKYMIKSGNKTQWTGTYPEKELIEKEIKNKNFYVCIENEVIVGVFSFFIGIDESYLTIEDGNWLNDEEYGTIHRVASNGTTKGVFTECSNFAKSKIGNVRCDTHADNFTMQNALEKNGFKRCGTVYVRNNQKRIAYHYLA